MEEINNNSDEVIPINFHLSQNYPNPFNNKTIIKYCVAYKTRVRITVYNSNNEIVKILVDEEKDAGTYEISFNAQICIAGESRILPQGNYHYQLAADRYNYEKQMILKY